MPASGSPGLEQLPLESPSSQLWAHDLGRPRQRCPRLGAHGSPAQRLSSPERNLQRFLPHTLGYLCWPGAAEGVPHAPRGTRYRVSKCPVDRGIFLMLRIQVLWGEEITLGLRLRSLGLSPCLAADLLGDLRHVTTSCWASAFSTPKQR